MNQNEVALLVRATLAGDEEAFSTLVRGYQDYAYGVAIGLLSDFDLARDVVQEAFLHAYRGLPKLKEPERFGGWLRGIVRNTSYRALRELARVRAMAEEFAAHAEPADHRPTPDRAADEAEQYAIVRRALEQLDHKNREVVSLYYVDGLSYADIAGFLGVTEATVLGRLQRSRVKLRKEMKMVEGAFKEQKLPDDFSGEIRRLLDIAAAKGREREVAIKNLAAIGEPAVEPLCEALRDPRPAARQAAARALCAIGDPRALGPLFRVCYSDDDGALWDVYLRGKILAIPGVRDELLKAVRTASYYGRWAALSALAYAPGDEEVFRCILGVFRDRNAGKLRGTALSALCTLKPGAAVDLLVEALRDPDLHRRSGWAWWEAVRRGAVLPVDVCVSGFTRKTAHINRMFAGWLLLRHGEKGREKLAELMRTGNPDEKATAALALAKAGNAEAFDALRQELIGGLQDQKWLRIVQRAVVGHYSREIVDWAAAHPDVAAHSTGIAWCLARTRIAAGAAAAEELLLSGNPSTRAAMVRRLARERGACFIPHLREILREGRPARVAREAFWRMHDLGDAALPAVREMQESALWTERKAAVCLLRRWGKLTPAEKAKAEQDEHIAVRHAARRCPRWPGERARAKQAACSPAGSGSGADP